MYKLLVFTTVIFSLCVTSFGNVSVVVDGKDRPPIASVFDVELTPLSQHKSDERAKRILQNDIGYRLKFQAIGRKFDYFVQLNRKMAIFNPNSTLSLWAGDTLISRQQHENYLIFDNTNEDDLWNGIFPEEFAQVVVKPNGELFMAIVQQDGETYSLEHIDQVQPGLTEDEHKMLASGGDWVIHKHSDIPGFSEGLKDCGVEHPHDNEDNSRVAPSGAESTQKRNQFPTRWSNCFTPSSTRRMSIGIATDLSYYRRMGQSSSAINSQITALFAHANYIYYYQVGVVLTVGEVIIQTSSGGPAWNYDKIGPANSRCADSLTPHLNSFSSWVRTERPNPQNPEGLWHLLTDCYPPPGVVGVAWLGVLCRTSSSNAAAAGMSSYSTNYWTTVAHEIGHNFRASHPFSMGTNPPAQGAAGGIMDYGDGRLNGIFQFSTPYARDDVCAEMRRAIGLSSSCISTYSSTCGNGILEFGEACDDTSSCCIQPGNPGACTLAPGALCSGSTNQCCNNCQIRPSWQLCELPGLGPNSGHCGFAHCAIPGTTYYSNGMFCTVSQANPCVLQYKTSPSGSCVSGASVGMYVPFGAVCSTTNSSLLCNGGGSCTFNGQGGPPIVTGGDSSTTENDGRSPLDDLNEKGNQLLDILGISLGTAAAILIIISCVVCTLMRRSRRSSPSRASSPRQARSPNAIHVAPVHSSVPPPYTDYAAAPPSSSPFAVGMVCQARFSRDGLWYRAQILDIRGNHYLVSYVDFGAEKEWVPLAALRM